MIIALIGLLATAMGVYKSFQLADGNSIGSMNALLCGLMFVVGVVYPLFLFFATKEVSEKDDHQYLPPDMTEAERRKAMTDLLN